MKYRVLWVVTLVLCLQTVTGQIFNGQAPNITPKEITLRVAKTASIDTELTTFRVDNVPGTPNFNFFISDFTTDSLAKLVANSRFNVSLKLKANLETERTPTTKILKVVAGADRAVSTATVTMQIVNSVSQINNTGLTIVNSSDVQTVISNLAQYTQSLCDVYINQSPATSLSRFRLFCLMFQAVYLNLPPSIFPEEPPNFNQPPAFVSSRMNFTVPENIPIGSLIGRLTATDRDGPQEISFSPMNAQTAALVRLTAPSGQSSTGRVVSIFLREQLDREEAAINTLYITAFDGQSTTTAMVLVALTDVNDNMPVFSRTEYRFTISSSAAPGYMVGTVFATDKDIGINARIRYSFSGLTTQASSLFSMNSIDGSIYVRQSLRTRINQTLTIVVRARDGGGLFTSATVRIFVTDRNTSSDCRNSSCNNGYCASSFNGTYSCYCYQGYYGSRCQYRNTSIDCRSSPCRNGGTCYRTNNGTFKCYCSQDFSGPLCEYRNTSSDCRNSSCGNGYCASSFNGTYRCYCYQGYYGSRCQYRNTSIDCRSSPCRNGGTCYRTNNGTFKCYCSRDFSGPLCEYRNTSSDCRNSSCGNGYCASSFNGTYRCYCYQGYYGLRCQYRNISIDCRSSPCRNGGTCYRTNNGTFKCYCSQDFSGPLCEYRNTSIDCRSSPCRNGGTCYQTNNGAFKCYCSQDFSGPLCEYRNTSIDCRNSPCRNGGTCYRTNNGTFKCYCSQDFSGPLCEYRNTSIDCRSSPCRNGGTCYQTNNGAFKCYCSQDFSGPLCEYRNTSIDCRSSPCRNGGTCYRTNNGTFKCYCSQDFSGPLCEYRYNSSQCDFNVCKNGGNCSRNVLGDVVCACPAGYTGEFCQEDVTLRFRVSTIVVNVRENNSPGIGLATVYVEDSSPESDPVYISSNDSQSILRFQEAFSRSTAAWDVILQRSLDREERSTWWFKLTVYRGNRKANSTLIINVNDTNDNSPVFRNSVYRATVDNDAVQGTPVMTIYATDIDTGVNGIVYYNITGGSAQRSAFKINNRTGVISVDGSLLSLVNQQIQLIVTAMDGGIPQRTTTASVFIIVRQGDGRLKFALTTPSVNVSESAVTGTLLVQLPIGPLSSGRRVSLTSNDTQGILALRVTYNTSSAIASVILNRPVDRERNESLAFNITASDGVTRINTTLVLNVTDVNDNAPAFTVIRPNITVDRRLLPGSVIGVVNASDPDGGSNGTLTFDIVGGTNGYTFFNISKQTGVLRLNRSVAFLPTPWVLFRVRVQDGGYPRQQNFTTVNISLVTGRDCANNPCRNGGSCSVSQNFTVICSCPSGYTGHRCERDVTLRFRVSTIVVNVRENNPPGIGLATVYVEDSSPGSDPVYISSNDSQSILRFQEAFSRSTAAWDVILQRSLDREERSTWWFKLTVYRGNRKANSTLIINVNDTNDNSPVFRNSVYRATVDNDAVPGTPVMTIYATDIDTGVNGIVYYNITGGSAQRSAFKINNRTGVISVDGSLLSLVNQQIQLIVTAMDGGIPQRTTTASVFIIVRQGDGRLKFALTTPSVNVSESAVTGTLLVQLPIGPLSSGRRVSLTSNDTQGILALRVTYNTSSAIASVILNRPVDRERNESLAFNITASDGVTRVNTTLVLNVTDVNDNAPAFTVIRPNITVDRRLLPGSVIGVVNASDPDGGRNGTLTFDIVGGTNGYTFFNISKQTGVLRLNRSVAFLPTPWVLFRVRVQDGGYPRQQNFTTVNISLVTGRDCANNPCRNGGSCSVSQNFTVICSCLSGYTGPRCEREASLRFRQNPLRVSVQEGTTTDVNGNAIVLGFLQVDDLLQPSTGQVFLASNDSRQIIRFTRISTSATATFQLTLRSPVDRERNPVMIFSVRATLGNRSTNGTVIINVTDVNDNSPQFNGTDFSASVESDSVPRTPVITVRASDADAGRNGTVFYSITGGSSQRSRFQINNMTGVISVKEPIDDLVDQQIQLIVTARDGGLPSRSRSTTVTINIKRGTGRLRFPVESTTVDVSEGVPRGTEIFRMAFNPQAPSVEIRTNDTQGIISLGFIMTGSTQAIVIITVNGNLDREKNETMTFNITASTGVNTASTLLILNITDVNDNAPVFNTSQTAFNVYRLASPGSRFGRVNASDPDDGKNANLTYDIVGGTQGYDSFNVSSQTGDLFIARYLTSVPSTVTLRIRARDGGIRRLETRQTVTINIITGASISVLHFNPSNYSVSALESLEPGNFLVQMVLLHADPRMRGAEVSFRDPSFTTYADPIVINSDMSYISLRLNNSLRNQISNRVTVNITAVVTNSSITAKSSVTIMIQRNAVPNNFAPVFSVSSYAASILPNIPNGTWLVTVSATDADEDLNGQIRYVMARGNKTFAVNATTGAVTTNASLTNLANTLQTLTVVAIDNGFPARNASVSVFIRIGNMPDDPTNLAPSFERPSYFFFVRENEPRDSVVGVVSASDASGGGLITYRLGNNGGGSFYLGQPAVSGIQSSVEIKTTQSLDREVVNSYALVVIASDGNTEATCTVTVQVQDVNDNNPVFSQQVYSVQVPVNAQARQIILSLAVTDPDSGDNGRVIFRKQENSNNDLSSAFLVFPSGRIIVSQPLQELGGQRVEFTVVATDNGTPSRVATATVQINITEASTNLSPVFTGVPESISIVENSPRGYRLFVATVTDLDGPYPPFISFPDRNSSETVEIIAPPGDNTGIYIIQLNTFLNREVEERRVFRIVASDGLNSTTATVTLVIQDVNDNAPRFRNASYNGVASSNLSIGATVLNVSATDPDQLENGRVRYSIQTSTLPGVFEINALTGVIRVASSLTSLVGQTVRLRIEAKDSGIPVLNTSVPVAITIQSESIPVGNNNPPQFTNDRLTVSVTENGPIGRVLGSVQVSDPDGQAVTLRTEGDTQAGIPLLSVTETTSTSISIFILRTNVRFDRETAATRTVLLIASDGTAETTATVTVQVEDMNDNPPQFNQTAYSASISSTAPIGSLVVQPVATDADSASFGEVTYSIISAQKESDLEMFSIDPRTGAIRTAQLLIDRSDDEASLIVRAMDGGQRSSYVQVIIRIS